MKTYSHHFNKPLFTFLILAIIALACNRVSAPPGQDTVSPEPRAPGTSKDTEVPVASTNLPAPITATLHPSEPVKIADKSGKGSLTMQMTQDGQGNLHVAWYDNLKITHRQLGADGQWSDATTLVDDGSLMPWGYKLLSSPDGQVCLLWLTVAEINKRCLVDRQWAEAQTIIDRSSGEAIMRFDAAFAPDGSLQILKLIASKGLYLGKINVFANSEGQINAYAFAIDPSGNSHVIVYWTTVHPTPYAAHLEHFYSSDQGQTWQRFQIPIGEGTTPTSGYDLLLKVDSGQAIHLLWKVGGGELYYSDWTLEKGWSTPEAADQSSFAASPQVYNYEQIIFVDKQGGVHKLRQTDTGLYYSRLE